MMTRSVHALLLTIGAFLLSSSRSLAEEQKSKDSINLVDLILKVGDELVDPRGHERVSFETTVRGVRGTAGTQTLTGWQKPGNEVIQLDDGFVVPAEWISNAKPVDLIASVRSSLVKDGEEEDVFATMERTAIGLGGNQHVAHAAWMTRLGEEDLAKKALEEARAARRDDSTVWEEWRKGRAWFYYAGMVHAFMQGADQEAIRYGTFLLKRYPEEAKKHHRQAASFLEDLQRRMSQPEVVPPKDPSTLSLEQQIDFWIRELDQIDVYQNGQPGGVDLGRAKSVQALISIGDAAIPKLLDVIEHDQRLTRSVHFWRDFAPYRTVLGVHEAALTAVMSILRIEFFDPGSTGDNFTGRGEEGQIQMVNQLRAYWKKYGSMPFDERMMTVLSDPNSSKEARREAGWNLATLNARQVIGTTVWTGSYENPKGDNPGVEKFKDPTIAELILRALDDELTAIEAKARQWKKEGRKESTPEDPFSFRGETFNSQVARRDSSQTFCSMLEDLGDNRIGPQLARRANSANDLVIRCDYSHAADQLGDSSALELLRDEIVRRKVASGSTKDDDLAYTLFWTFTNANLPDAMDALKTITNRDHALYPVMADFILDGSPFDSEAEECHRHPWALTMLESTLYDDYLTEFIHETKWDEDRKEWTHHTSDS